jgi:hypothetical protein
MSDSMQRAVLDTLLDAHPKLLHRDELRVQLGDCDQALRVLIADGLATRLGDLVGASRAAVRFSVLAG